MICNTCGIEGHDSQGNKELCLVAVVDRCKRMERQNSEMKKILRFIVDPIFKADEEKEPDKHVFCVCVYCRAWNLYEDDPVEKPA